MAFYLQTIKKIFDSVKKKTNVKLHKNFKYLWDRTIQTQIFLKKSFFFTSISECEFVIVFRVASGYSFFNF